MAIERFWEDKPAPEDEFKAEIEATEKELAELDAKKQQDTEPDPEVERMFTEEEKDPEPAPEPEPVKAEEKPAQRQVPLEALKEEREKRQALERRLQELEARLQPQPQYQEPEPEKIPDVNEDPLAAIEYTARELQEMKRAQAEQAERTRLINMAQMATAEYAKNVPDYKDAYAHVLNARRYQHQLAGVPEHMMADALARDEMEIINTAWRLNRNPGELVYEYAKTYGYGPRAEENKTETPPAPAVDPIEREAKKAAAGMTLTRGKAPTKDLAPEDIVNLRGAAFDAAWSKVMSAGNKPKAASVLEGLRKRR